MSYEFGNQSGYEAGQAVAEARIRELEAEVERLREGRKRRPVAEDPFVLDAPLTGPGAKPLSEMTYAEMREIYPRGGDEP